MPYIVAVRLYAPVQQLIASHKTLCNTIFLSPMEKKLLSSARIKKSITLQQMADRVSMDVSNYNRKEKGNIKIRPEEWERFAKALDVGVEEIYEPDETHYFVFKDSSIGNYLGTNNIYSIPEYLLGMPRKYIEKFEEEIRNLKKEKSN